MAARDAHLALQERRDWRDLVRPLVPAPVLRRRRARRGRDGAMPTPVALGLHRVASALARAILRRRPEAPQAEREGPPKVTILLMHAYGMGGTIRTTLNTASYLADRHEVEVLCVLRSRDKPFFPFPAGVTVTSVDDHRRHARPDLAARVLGSFRSRLMHPGDRGARACTLWTDVQLLRHLWRVRSGLLVGTRPALNLLVADAAGRHLVAVGEEHMHLHKHNASILAAIKRRYGALDAAVTLTDGDRAAYVRLLGRATRIESIPNAVAPIGGGNAPLTAHTVLAVGRMSSQKGFDRLIRAFALIADEQPDWNLRICGGRGHAQERLERLIATKGLQDRVKLAGRTRQVGNELARASIYALSSRFEGLPMVMIEAMSKGVPVVAFDCPTGPRDVIRNGVNGILVPDGDEAALARAMLELMRDEDERRRLGAAGAERALDYSLGEIGPRWDALIQDLVRA